MGTKRPTPMKAIRRSLMTRPTEWLLRAAAALFLLWFGWQLAVQSVVAQVNAQARATQAERDLAQCRGEKR